MEGGVGGGDVLLPPSLPVRQEVRQVSCEPATRNASAQRVTPQQHKNICKLSDPPSAELLNALNHAKQLVGADRPEEDTPQPQNDTPLGGMRGELEAAMAGLHRQHQGIRKGVSLP